MIKINAGTRWEAEFDPSIQPEDFVEVVRWYGKNKGLWRVVKIESIVVDQSNQKDFGYWSSTVGKRDNPPIGMQMAPALYLQRIMDDDYDRPYRRDRTEATSQYVVKITPDYIATKQAQYDAKIAALNELLAGTWVV